MFENTYMVGGSVSGAGTPRTVVGVHGAGVLCGRFVTGITTASAIVDQHASRPLGALGQGLRGSITLYVLESGDPKLTILPDPLGGGLVFSAKDADGVAVSSDLGALVSFLGLIGKAPRKSLQHVATYVATGSGGLVDSSYENIGTVPQFSFLEFAPAGVEIRDYPAKYDFFHPDVSYDEALGRVQQEILENVLALAESGLERKVAHLTGGVDSRLVLAAILAAGKKDEFSFYCSGGPTEPDKIIAGRLAVEFGLTMTEHSGLNFRLGAESLDQQLLWGFQHTSGINSGVTHHGGLPSRTVIASGGYGELLRSFYNKGTAHAGTARETAERIYGRLAFSADPARRLLSETAAGEAQVSLHNIIASAATLGVREDARLDYVYLNRRNRYYVGEISRSFSPFSPRFDPLYSVAGASLSLKLDGMSREANIVGMDLIERFSPGLSTLPYDYDRFGESYIHLRGKPVLRSFTRVGEPKVDSVLKTPVVNARRIPPMRPTEADRLRANALKMPPRLITQFPEIRTGLREIIAGIPSRDFRAAFNPRAVAVLTDREPSHRAYYRNARDLYAGLLWYARG
ncbi:hypothetical protein [Pseudarthrobacter sp. H2]|uniref:hypothetical protein n=1 Tax=Pseudarthrobacter sp. H2 TaxID=3418415 RepID=UPI003CEA8E9D